MTTHTVNEEIFVGNLIPKRQDKKKYKNKFHSKFVLCPETSCYLSERERVWSSRKREIKFRTKDLVRKSRKFFAFCTKISSFTVFLEPLFTHVSGKTRAELRMFPHVCVYVCMHMCVCIIMCTHWYMYVYMCACICVHTGICMCICVHAYVYTLVYVCVYVCMHMCTHWYMYVYMCACICVLNGIIGSAEALPILCVRYFR